MSLGRDRGAAEAIPLSILVILLTALVIRLADVNHGFPLIYHPDEPTVIRTALGIRFNPNPKHFDWPHLYIYLNYFVYMAFAKIRDILTSLGFQIFLAPIIWNDNLIFYLLSRVFSALLGALSIIPLYCWVKKLVSKTAGLVSASFLALAPFHVRHSHYALIDVPMLFFLLWSLYFSTNRPILCGLFLGFSASTKYNGVLGAVFIIIFYVLSKRKFVDYIKTGVFSVVGFLIGTPFALLDFKTFIRTDGPQGALWQFKNVERVVFSEQLEHFFKALSSKLPMDLGYGAALVFVCAGAAIITFLIKRRVVSSVVAASFLVLLGLTFYVSGVIHNRSHYYFVIYPYFFLLVGWVFATAAGKIKARLCTVGLLLLLLVPSFTGSIKNILELKYQTTNTIYGGDRITPDEKTP